MLRIPLAVTIGREIPTCDVAALVLHAFRVTHAHSPLAVRATPTGFEIDVTADYTVEVVREDTRWSVRAPATAEGPPTEFIVGDTGLNVVTVAAWIAAIIRGDHGDLDACRFPDDHARTLLAFLRLTLPADCVSE